MPSESTRITDNTMSGLLFRYGRNANMPVNWNGMFNSAMSINVFMPALRAVRVNGGVMMVAWTFFDTMAA